MNRFVIRQQTERYGLFEELPERIILVGGTEQSAKWVLRAIDDYIVAGMGCDFLFVLDGEEPDFPMTTSPEPEED